MRKRWLICFTATLALASWGCSNDEEALETPVGVETTVKVYRFTTSNEGLDTIDFNSMKD